MFNTPQAYLRRLDAYRAEKRRSAAIMQDWIDQAALRAIKQDARSDILNRIERLEG